MRPLSGSTKPRAPPAVSSTATFSKYNSVNSTSDISNLQRSLDIQSPLAKRLGILFGKSNHCITSTTKKTSNLSGSMVVVDR
jgi:hypothetical protein